MLSYAVTLINPHVKPGSECFMPRSTGGKEGVLTQAGASAHARSQGWELVEFLASGQEVVLGSQYCP